MINKHILAKYSKLAADHDSLKLLVKSLESITALTKLYRDEPQELMTNAYIITNAIAIKVNNKSVTKALMDNGINLITNKAISIPADIHYVIQLNDNKQSTKPVKQPKLNHNDKFILLHHDKTQALTTKAVFVNISCLLRQLKMKYNKQIAKANNKGEQYNTIKITDNISKVLMSSTALYTRFATASWKQQAHFSFKDSLTNHTFKLNPAKLGYDGHQLTLNKNDAQELVNVNYQLISGNAKSIQIPHNYIKALLKTVYTFRDLIKSLDQNKYRNSTEHQAIAETLATINESK